MLCDQPQGAAIRTWLRRSAAEGPRSPPVRPGGCTVAWAGCQRAANGRGGDAVAAAQELAAFLLRRTGFFFAGPFAARAASSSSARASVSSSGFSSLPSEALVTPSVT